MSTELKPGYRPCVGIMAINREGLVWIGRRADIPQDAEGPGSWWQMPQGGIDENEDPKAAALRELYEETGMTSVELIGETDDWLTYDLPSHIAGKAWGGRFKGQQQKWFAVRFLGLDTEVRIDPPDGHQREFDSWRWEPVSSVVDLIVPFKRDVYIQVVARLGALAKPVGPAPQ